MTDKNQDDNVRHVFNICVFDYMRIGELVTFSIFGINVYMRIGEKMVFFKCVPFNKSTE